jgi:hypothetical protein
LYRGGSSSRRKPRTRRPTNGADVPALMDELFPCRPRDSTMSATKPDYRNDIVFGVLQDLLRLLGDRRHLLSPDRWMRIRTHPTYWWADPMREDRHAVAYEIWHRMVHDRASLDDANVVAAARAFVPEHRAVPAPPGGSRQPVRLPRRWRSPTASPRSRSALVPAGLWTLRQGPRKSAGGSVWLAQATTRPSSRRRLWIGSTAALGGTYISPSSRVRPA